MDNVETKQVRITVFTPTYNRSYIIRNLYESLQGQIYSDFEWLVIDDGSTDDTESLFKKLARECEAFPIRYVKTDNGGKHRAINTALDLAYGEIFLLIDSDDVLADDALAKVDAWFKDLDGADSVKGIVANAAYLDGTTPNHIFEEDGFEASLLDMYSFPPASNQSGVNEHVLAFFTAFHRLYKYPEFSGETFMTEAVTWNRMAHDGYKMRFYNDSLSRYEYLEDGLTNKGGNLFKDNPHGYGLWLSEKSKFMNESITQRMRMWYTFSCDMQNQLDSAEIAECVNAPRPAIRCCQFLHGIWNRCHG